VGGWRRLHNEELCDLYISPDIKVIKSRRIRWTEHVAYMGEITNAFSILVGKFEGKKSLRRPMCRWKDNIGMDLREIGWEYADWMHLTQDRGQWWALVNMVMSFWFP
jgi:hypothetical protein